MKIVEKYGFFAEILTKIRKSLTNFCEYFECGAVRRNDILVDLDKCCKMSIRLQNRLRYSRDTALTSWRKSAKFAAKSE